MRNHLLRASSITLALLGGLSLATAQQAPPAADGQQQMQQEKAQQTPSGQHGKEEPSSYAPSSKPQDTAAFVNGALAVPGAPTQTDTVPAKFSEKNAADDKLITIAYTFKYLSDDERRAIFEGLKDQPAGSAYNAAVGDELPITVELRPMPREVVARVPQTEGYQFTVADNRVLLVSPASRIVVGSFPDAKEPGATVGGRRGQ